MPQVMTMEIDSCRLLNLRHLLPWIHKTAFLTSSRKDVLVLVLSPPTAGVEYLLDLSGNWQRELFAILGFSNGKSALSFVRYAVPF